MAVRRRFCRWYERSHRAGGGLAAAADEEYREKQRLKHRDRDRSDRKGRKQEIGSAKLTEMES